MEGAQGLLGPQPVLGSKPGPGLSGVGAQWRLVWDSVPAFEGHPSLGLGTRNPRTRSPGTPRFLSYVCLEGCLQELSGVPR